MDVKTEAHILNLIVISGRSGSGKSTVLKTLEDNNFYCIDNLPAKLIPALLKTVNNNIETLAVCIDARNHIDSIQEFLDILDNLPTYIKTQVIYLDSSTPVLIKRFSETRRKHPLSTQTVSLKEAIQAEKAILEPIASIADLTISTNDMNSHELTSFIKKRLFHDSERHDMAILFTSFGFKGGILLTQTLFSMFAVYLILFGNLTYVLSLASINLLSNFFLLMKKYRPCLKISLSILPSGYLNSKKITVNI